MVARRVRRRDDDARYGVGVSVLRMAPAMGVAVTQELDGEAKAERRQQDQGPSNTSETGEEAKGNRHAGNV